MSGSQLDVTYQLLLNSNPIGPPVLGTGGIINFGPQSSSGTYSVQVSGNNGSGYCAGPYSLSSTTTLTIEQPPIVSAGSDISLCNGQNTQLNASVTYPTGSLVYSLTSSGGSYTSEKWMNITTEINGTGTVVWAQGNGTIGNGSGLLTNELIDLSAYAGQTLYLNAYDQYDAIDKQWRKERFAAMGNKVGFSESFYIPNQGTGVGSQDLEVKTKKEVATKAELTRAFKKHMGSKMTNKTILNKFIEQIA